MRHAMRPGTAAPARPLAVWAGLCLLVNLPGGGYSWHYFVEGSRALFAGNGVQPPGGLHLYADYPNLQIGPVTFLVAQVLRQLGPTNGLLAAQTAMMALGLLVLHTLHAILPRLRPDLAGGRARTTLTLSGGAFLVAWASLAVHYAHLDDVLALTFATLAVRALVDGNPAVAGVCLALAADAKPWAAVFAPLVLAAPRGTRRHAAFYLVAGISAGWLPFVLADPGTLGAAGFAITNEPSSALRALGVAAAGTPAWDRPAQLLLGCALGVLAVRRGRWPAVLLLGVAARLALDPGVYDYYTAGALVGTLCWELLGLRRPTPVWTLGLFSALFLAPRLSTAPAVLGELRLWALLLTAAVVLAAPRGWCAQASPERVVGDVSRVR
ncbi:hypothetical protein [Streptacidiphilus cavernicola]|uniref:DUF2029 domain-containing protein n=1 Tax=Streptacidiphilus cavernicola TaxID=3342716 RepID=A0ABV6VNP0_9ACTN